MSENATLGSQDFTEESDEERELVERIERHLKDKAPNKQEKAVDNEGAWSEGRKAKDLGFDNLFPDTTGIEETNNNSPLNLVPKRLSGILQK